MSDLSDYDFGGDDTVNAELNALSDRALASASGYTIQEAIQAAAVVALTTDLPGEQIVGFTKALVVLRSIEVTFAGVVDGLDDQTSAQRGADYLKENFAYLDAE